MHANYELGDLMNPYVLYSPAQNNQWAFEMLFWICAD